MMGVEGIVSEASVCVCVCVCVPVCLLAQNHEKLQMRNWCNLVGMRAVVHHKSLLFDDIWLYTLRAKIDVSTQALCSSRDSILSVLSY